MIDFHSHLLPGIDDGSDSVDTSLAMLSLWQNQGIDKIVATPHFYADKMSPDEFLANRQQAYEDLCFAVSHTPNGQSMPSIMLGAEVYFFSGIGKFEELDKLCLVGTRILLLEMPFSAWTDRTIAEVEEIISRGFVVVLAHLERYKSVASRKLINRLLNLDLYVQANTGYFLDFWTRGTAIRELKNGRIMFIGSDAHNIKDRMPNMEEALKYIKLKIADDYPDVLNMLQEDIIVENRVDKE